MIFRGGRGDEGGDEGGGGGGGGGGGFLVGNTVVACIWK